jgi:hypothetical protein
MDKGPAEEAEATVYWLAINGKGEMFVNENDEPVILQAPGLILGRLPPDPESFVSLRDVASWSGLSESTVERLRVGGGVFREHGTAFDQAGTPTRAHNFSSSVRRHISSVHQNWNGNIVAVLP